MLSVEIIKDFINYTLDIPKCLKITSSLIFIFQRSPHTPSFSLSIIGFQIGDILCLTMLIWFILLCNT